MSRRSPTCGSLRGFTLVEVVLAILIISGIMTVLLYFYQRAAEVRQIALQETEYISTARLVMEQITSELRTARAAPDHFLALDGTSNSILFVCTALPSTARWLADTNEPLQGLPATDLKKVSYSLAGGTNLTATRGLDRQEEFLVGLSTPQPANPSGTRSTNELSSADQFLITNDFAATNLVSTVRQPLTDKIRFLQFRFWDGAAWTNTWSGLELPGGVEISLGRESMPVESEGEGYPYEMFRRVVFLPQSGHPTNRQKGSEAGAGEEFAL